MSLICMSVQSSWCVCVCGWRVFAVETTVHALGGRYWAVQMRWSFHLLYICIGLGKFSTKVPIGLWSLTIGLISIEGWGKDSPLRNSFFRRMKRSKVMTRYGWFVYYNDFIIKKKTMRVKAFTHRVRCEKTTWNSEFFEHKLITLSSIDIFFAEYSSS